MGAAGDGSTGKSRAPYALGEPVGRLSAGSRFENLGALPRTEQQRQVYPYARLISLSPSGNVVLGLAMTDVGVAGRSSLTDHVIVWRAPGELVDLTKSIGAGASSDAVSASNDGNVVIGSWSDAHGTHPFIHDASDDTWYPASPGVADVDSLPKYPAQALAVSPEGTFVLGTDGRASYLWPRAGGQSLLSDRLPLHISMLGPDAHWCVGTNKTSAFIWRPHAGIRDLDVLPDDAGSAAYCATDDGQIVFGASGDHLVRWSENTGMENLGNLPPSRPFVLPPDARRAWTRMNSDGAQHHVSLDGQFFRATTDGEEVAGIKAGHAFLWTRDKGVQNVTELMTAAGADPAFAARQIKALALAPAGNYLTGISEASNGDLIRWRLYLRRSA